MLTTNRSPACPKPSPERRRRKRDARTTRWITLAFAASLLVVLLAGCSKRQSTPVPATPTHIPPSQTAAPSTVTPATTGLPDVGAALEAAAPPEVYTVARGDTLSGIASRFDCNLKALIKENDIADPSLLRVGQKLRLSTCQTELESSSTLHLLPNSEFVNGPAYVDFDIASFAAAQGGYLAEYYEKVGGKVLSGPEIVSLVAHHYSVGPRTLLAILELKSGWVTDPNPSGEALSFPMGYKGGGWELLSRQLAWAADELNQGYYDWRGRGMTPIAWRDGSVTRYDPSLNAATAGLQRFFSLGTNKRRWEKLVSEGPESFVATYRQLFGDPAQYAIEPLIPADTAQPYLSLPWPQGELWYYTGGPHGGWSTGSAWAALDFAPAERGLGCRVSKSWATASASGLVIYSQDGEVVIDLDKDGHEETGWVLFYLHVASRGRVPAGTRVKRGDHIGHASCEGGMSEATHLHIARKYNGEWIAADGPLPLVLSGWRAHSSGEPYEGTLTRGKKVRTACECQDKDYNGLVADR